MQVFKHKRITKVKNTEFPRLKDIYYFCSENAMSLRLTLWGLKLELVTLEKWPDVVGECAARTISSALGAVQLQIDLARGTTLARQYAENGVVCEALRLATPM